MRTLVLVLFASLARAEPTGPLPDLSREAIRGQCERPKVETTASDPAGADQTYVGTFTMTADGTVTGAEVRYLFANAAWKAARSEDGHSGYDCINHWDVKGVRIDPTGCPQCDFGIQFDADISYVKSTCPQRLVVDGNHFRSAYDVDLKPDGTLDVYFSNSGKKFARGAWRGDQYTWISDHRCVSL
jgi:hypothetical protein